MVPSSWRVTCTYSSCTRALSAPGAARDQLGEPPLPRGRQAAHGRLAPNQTHLSALARDLERLAFTQLRDRALREPELAMAELDVGGGPSRCAKRGRARRRTTCATSCRATA